jgi:serine/threonine-protein kinase
VRDTSQGCDVWREAMGLFDDWFGLSLEERDATLARLARDKPPVHERLLHLLKADAEADCAQFLDGSAVSDALDDEGQETSDQALRGRKLGPWTLERLLGSGGMGQVWLASRHDGLYKGEAAVKMLRELTAAPGDAERFAREGRILARLAHPNIARLLDAGLTAEGQRYLVLEYVPGERIDHYCDRRRLDIAARVRLFLQVCAAVAHAHANLIVHRDLKPSNILVMDDGTAKLLDFGVAKLLADQTGEAMQLTQAMGAVLTPEYAAPEQIVGGGSITTATDVYALGTVLYRLLSGCRPFGSHQATPLELARAIVEDELRRASTRSRGEDASERAAARATTPERLRRSLSGDLDNILDKALKKAPAERYPSVQAFADDLERYLGHEPVAARPDRAAYRATKFLRRHWIGASALATLIIAISAGIAGVVWQAHLARAEAKRVQAIQSFLIGLFNEADPARAQGRELTVRELLARGERDLQTKLADQPRLNATLNGVLVELYTRLGDEKKALPLAEARRDLALDMSGPESLEYGDAMLSLALLHEALGSYELADKANVQAQAVFRHYPKERAGELLRIDRQLAFSLSRRQKTEAAIAAMLAVLPRLEAHFGPAHWETIETRALLASMYADQGKHEKAAAIFSEFEPLLASAAPEHALEVATYRADQAYNLWLAGQFDRSERSARFAIAEFDRLAGPDNSLAIGPSRTLGMALLDHGRFLQSVVAFDDGAARAARVFGPEDKETALTESFGIPALIMVGRIADAERVARQALHNAPGKEGLSAPDLRGIKRRSALALIFAGKPGEALALLREIFEQGEIEKPYNWLRQATALRFIAGAHMAQGSYATAAAVAHRSAEIYGSHDDHVAVIGLAKTQLTEALALARAGSAPAAETALAAGERNLRRKLPASHPDFALVQLVRAEVLQAGGRSEEAQALRHASRELLEKSAGAGVPREFPLVF